MGNEIGMIDPRINATDEDLKTNDLSNSKLKELLAYGIDIEEAVKRLKKYVVTYDQQSGYKDYNTDTYIQDVLYGLAVSLDDKTFSYAKGFDKFKKELIQYLSS